jgi:hypothetical protein
MNQLDVVREGGDPGVLARSPAPPLPRRGLMPTAHHPVRGPSILTRKVVCLSKSCGAVGDAMDAGR